MSKKKDTYEIWLLQGVAEKKLKVIRDLVSKQVSQEQVASSIDLRARLYGDDIVIGLSSIPKTLKMGRRPAILMLNLEKEK